MPLTSIEFNFVPLLKIYSLLKTLALNKSVKANLKYVTINEWGNLDLPIMDILRSKHLGFAQCEIRYCHDAEFSIQLNTPEITNEELKFIKKNALITYAKHPAVIKSGLYSSIIERSMFGSMTSKSETIQWINRLERLDMLEFTKFKEIWKEIASHDPILWDYLCSTLNHDTNLYDKMFPANLARTGFVVIFVSNSMLAMEKKISIEHIPFMYAREHYTQELMSLFDRISDQFKKLKNYDPSIRKQRLSELYKAI